MIKSAKILRLYNIKYCFIKFKNSKKINYKIIVINMNCEENEDGNVLAFI